jgi:DNA-binding MurR/RpiR family transcriptional regulator
MAKSCPSRFLTAAACEVFGVGGSFPICTDFARKLTFLGKKAYARSDWDEQDTCIR